MKELSIVPGQSSSLTLGSFLAPFPSLCFSVLSSLSVPLCVMFLLSPLPTLLSPQCPCSILKDGGELDAAVCGGLREGEAGKAIQPLSL